MREQFEKLPEIRKIMNENGIYFMNHSGWYEARDFKDFEHEQYINGAWYAFQEQQNRYDELDQRATGMAMDQMNTAKLNAELQKRIDAALQLINCMTDDYVRNELEQALKGGDK